MPALKRIAVLDHDPDLAGALSPSEVAVARTKVIARTIGYPKGPWQVGEVDFDRAGSLGLLLIDGLLVRKVSVGPRACAELLGPGDVLQPWLQVGADSSVSVEVDWDAPEQLTLAVLDRAFAAAIGPYPEITTTIARRIMTRTHWLAFQLAVCHIRRVEERLALVLWHLADRWGRMTPRGVEISIALPHHLLGFMIGARRPAVTLAVKDLEAAGTLERRARSRWVLHGSPPASYDQLHADAAHRRLVGCGEDEPPDG